MPVIKRRSKEGQILWCVRRVVGGERVFRSFGVGQAARIAAERFDGQLVADRRSAQLGMAADRTVAEAIEAAQEVMTSRVRERTAVGYRIQFRRLVELVGHVKLGAVNRSLAYDLQVMLAGLELAPSHINKYTVLLSQVFDHAVDRGWLPTNPIRGYRALPYRDPHETRRAIPEGDLAKILGVVTPVWRRDLVWCLAATGMRDDEMCGLRWEDIGEATITIKAYSGRRVKRKASNRIIPLPDCLRPILARHRAAEHDVPFGDGDGKRISAVLLSQWWFKWRKRHGFPYRLHDFRHTYASRLASQGVNMFAAMKLLGHANIKTTMIYYQLSENEVLEQGRRVVVVPPECQGTL